ncbi:unnamed protein product [Rotaria sordida]|uniref:Uncharacterized protein n=1 Tax=Rotaria sordida TaxID=392033 RepID=A0A815KLQ7_9BILA|nr:unnamed protein product [Rotaria sordida]
MQLGIYSYPDLTTLFSIAGFYTGCFVMESLLQSTLECFYNQTCIDELRSYLVSNTSLTVNALDSSLPSRFFENSTIQKLVDELMVEQWNLSIMFESYYSACQPIKCTYSYTAKHNIIYILTTVFGLIGGMVTILKLVIRLLIKIVSRNKRLCIATTVCSSIFVTNAWINYIDGRSSNDILTVDDFRWTGPNTFRALSGFCELINETISENLIRFYSTQYVSATITSTQLFQSTAQYFFKQFISSTTQDLLLSLQVIRDTTQANSLWSVAGNNTNQPIIGLWQKATNSYQNFNLFPTIPPSTNPFDLRVQRISTRSFILCLLLSTITIVIYISSVKVTDTININVPTIKKYSELYSIYSETLTCPCTTISIDYKAFLHVKHTFHQICISFYVSDNWRQILSLSSLNNAFYFRDFRASCKFFFQALSTFCELTNKTISDSLTRFYSTQYISAAVVSSDLLYLQMQSIFEQFISLITNELLLSLQMIQNTTQANALFSARWTNYDLRMSFSPRLPGMQLVAPVPQVYSNCRCDVSLSCIEQSAIYDTVDTTTKLFSIPGIYSGCFVMESLLQSTLECFYNQTCIEQLSSYFLSNTSLAVTTLDSSLPSRFFENSTIQELVDKLMVEQWNLSTTFESYYSACQPIKCTYSYMKKHDVIYMITTMFGLVGGLMTILKLVVPRFVKIFAYLFLKR